MQFLRYWIRWLLSDKMFDMPTVSISIRELQQNLKRVLARVERGQVVQVTRHRRPVARLEPVHAETGIEPWPDLEARTRAVFGDRTFASAGSDAVLDGRGER